MSYLGRKGAVAPLTSADIPVGIVEGTDIAFLENASGTQNLGGTYSTERMYLNDSYTLTGDVNITNHLVLGTVGGADVLIMDDGSTRTITGSGTLESGNVLQDTQRTSVTGMTGELGSGVTLGSAVTGSPNLNLGNATFPSGQIIQTITNSFETISGGVGACTVGNGSSGQFTGYKQETVIRNFAVGNKLLIWINGGSLYGEDTSTDYQSLCGVYVADSSQANYHWGGIVKGSGSVSGNGSWHAIGSYVGCLTGYSGRITVYAAVKGNGGTGRWVNDQNDTFINVILMEQQG